MTAAPTPVQQHAGRVARMVAWISIAAPLVTPLVHAAVLRWPAVGTVMGLLEVGWRIVFPTVPARPAAAAAESQNPPM